MEGPWLFRPGPGFPQGLDSLLFRRVQCFLPQDRLTLPLPLFEGLIDITSEDCYSIFLQTLQLGSFIYAVRSADGATTGKFREDNGDPGANSGAGRTVVLAVPGLDDPDPAGIFPVNAEEAEIGTLTAAIAPGFIDNRIPGGPGRVMLVQHLIQWVPRRGCRIAGLRSVTADPFRGRLLKFGQYGSKQGKVVFKQVE